MSKMKMDRKPPLPRSPIRLRSRRAMQSNSTVLQSVQTPPGSLTKSVKLTRTWDIQETELRPEYGSISCELQSLAKMVQDEFKDANPSMSGLATFNGSIFERGRFYDEYSARRDERLKRKKMAEEQPKKAAYDLGVTMDSTISKRRGDSKKLEGLRKSVAVAYSTERSKETPRYMLRSSSIKENKKPSLSVTSSSVKPLFGTERKVSTRRTRKI